MPTNTLRRFWNGNGNECLGSTRGTHLMLLKPHGRIDSDDLALFRGTPRPSPDRAGLDDSRMTVMGPDFATGQSIQLPPKSRAASLHRSKELLAWVDGSSGLLRIQTLDAQPIAEIAPPRLLPGASDWVKQGFEDCYFDDGGEFLWLAAPLGDKELEVQLLRVSNWSFVGKQKVEGRHDGSSKSFHETGRPGLVSLWLAAGQDGQDVYWLNGNDQGFSCELVPRLADTPPPTFSPDGSHFVTAYDDGTLRCYEFATMREVGSGLKSPVRNDHFMVCYCYFDNRHALAKTNENRIFLINTSQMRLVEEVAVEGHEPRPVGEYYPTLANEPGLCTDITWIERIGDVVVFYSDREILWYRVRDAKSA